MNLCWKIKWSISFTIVYVTLLVRLWNARSEIVHGIWFWWPVNGAKVGGIACSYTCLFTADEEVWGHSTNLTPIRTYSHLLLYRKYIGKLYGETICGFIFVPVCMKWKCLPPNHILENISFKLICNKVGLQHFSFWPFEGEVRSS